MFALKTVCLPTIKNSNSSNQNQIIYTLIEKNQPSAIFYTQQNFIQNISTDMKISAPNAKAHASLAKPNPPNTTWTPQAPQVTWKAMLTPRQKLTLKRKNSRSLQNTHTTFLFLRVTQGWKKMQNFQGSTRSTFSSKIWLILFTNFQKYL